MWKKFKDSTNLNNNNNNNPIETHPIRVHTNFTINLFYQLILSTCSKDDPDPLSIVLNSLSLPPPNTALTACQNLRFLTLLFFTIPTTTAALQNHRYLPSTQE